MASRTGLAGLVLALALWGAGAGADDAPAAAPAADEPILLGQAAPLSGPAAALGLGMRAGIEAAFAEANRSGGIDGRRLALRAEDDGYEPTRSIAVTTRLLDEHRVFGLIGSVGTPTSAAVLPIVTQRQVPFIGAFTGAEVLRSPPNRFVVNVRASYFQETETMVERLTRDLGVTRIGIFYQDDAFGRAGLAGVQRALDRRGMALVAEGTYERNTTAVRTALLALRKADPQAVIMVGAYKPCAEFIKIARGLGLAWRFVNISFVGSDALAAELGDQGEGVVVTQVVPFPGDESIPVVRRYRAALAALGPEHRPGFVSLEGYIAARALIEMLGRIDGPPSREAFVEHVAGTHALDLGGLTLKYGPGDNQGLDEVYLTVLRRDGTYQPVASLPR